MHVFYNIYIMRKATLLLITFFIASFAINVFSQESRNNPKKAYRNGDFWDHWFLSVGAGGQMYFGEDDNKAQTKDRITPSFQLSTGKWITHAVGARLQVGGYKLKGWNDGVDGMYRTTTRNIPGYTVSGLTWYDPQWLPENRDNRVWAKPKKELSPKDQMWLHPETINGYDAAHHGELYLQDLRYFDVHIDAMLNLTSATCGYKPNRFFNWIAYIGAGLAYEYGEINGLVPNLSFAPNAGCMFNFRLHKAWDLGLDVKGTVVAEAFDSHLGGETETNYWTQEGYLSAVLGLTYKFKQREFEVVYEMDPNEIQLLNDRINALMIPVPIPACPECAPVPPGNPIVYSESLMTTVYLTPVHFPLDVHLVPKKEMYKIELAVKFLTDDPARTMHLEGYADRKTGNPKYNQGISERRVREVRRIMVEKYGINPSRLTIGWKGDIVQPFDVNELNRAVLFVGDEDAVNGRRTPVSSKISTTKDVDVNNVYRSR